MSCGTALVVGVGAEAGLGASLARRFAQEGFCVFISGRTARRLDAVAAAIRRTGGRAEPVVADATKEDQVSALFDKASAEGGLEFVVYNAGGFLAKPILELTGGKFEATWRQNAYAGFLVGREAIRRMLPQARGTVIFTGATASLRAKPPFTAFAAAKAALRSVAQGLAREFGPHGIHVAHVVVDGVIEGERARQSFAGFSAAQESGELIDPDAIAETYLAVHRQPRSAWTHELDLRPFKEPF
ncbi:MAG TPA: SDR family NAD(P)-dependent oxidoreductase [Methylocella sp.]|nr:SDR family NAD(P)-dependent oxidoreductase [Methylocella sp.]